MLTVSIIDDDKLSRHILKNYIERTDFLSFFREYDSAVAALADPNINKPHVIMLDIEMPEMTGLEFLEKSSVSPQIIITTINKDYAVNAFDFDVTDFLIKPLQYARFLQAMHRVKKVSEQSLKAFETSNHIYIKSNNGYTRIDFDEIVYIEAYSDYMNIHTYRERFTALSTMKAIEQRLPEEKFIRVHRSYMVHLDKINRFEDNMITLGEKVIPVSRSCKENLLKRLNFF